jgi:hypothetical protein
MNYLHHTAMGEHPVDAHAPLLALHLHDAPRSFALSAMPVLSGLMDYGQI